MATLSIDQKITLLRDWATQLQKDPDAAIARTRTVYDLFTLDDAHHAPLKCVETMPE